MYMVKVLDATEFILTKFIVNGKEMYTAQRQNLHSQFVYGNKI